MKRRNSRKRESTVEMERVREETDFFKSFNQMLEKIFSGKERHMTREEYMEYYLLIHDKCTCARSNVNQKHSQKSNNNIKEDIYSRIKSFYIKHIDSIRQKCSQYPDEETLLAFYTKQWEDYKFSSKVLDGICNYINRYLCDSAPEHHIHKVGVLAKIEWRDSLLQDFGAKVSKSVLKLIEKDREGVLIDTSLVRGVIDCFVELSAVGKELDENVVKVFEESFQKPFLDQTQKFYFKESEEFLQKNPFVDYMEKVTVRLEEEKHRIHRYLNQLLLLPLITTVENALIVRQIDRFKLEFQNLLIGDNIKQLKTLYDLVTRVPSAIAELCEHFKSHVKKEGMETISGVTVEALENPQLFIGTIWKVYHKYKTLLIESLQSDHQFFKALDSASMDFINDNSVTRLSNSKKTAELLAKYCDSLLKVKREKDSRLDDNEIERLLIEAVEIFKFIHDKDVFNQFYQKQMAHRMINELTANDDFENLVLGRFKEMCGMEYTQKLQKIYQDIKISRELDEKFRATNSGTTSVDFSVKVISQAASPFQAKICRFLIPAEMDSLYNNYKAFYINKHQGRKLSWLNNMAKAEITATYGPDRKYYITASAFQTAIILLFNSNETLTIQQIIDNTDIEQRIVIEIMKIILQTKILVSKGTELSTTSCIQLNTNYKNKKRRFNINKPIKLIEKEDDEKTHKQIDENRKYVTEAAIVRIMKTRKQLTHNELIAEVLELIGAKFNPTIPLIKKAIDDLINREYMERVPGTTDTYRYLA